MKERFVLFRGEKIRLTKGTDGLWRSGRGTIFAYADDSHSFDLETRCGLGIFSLPADHPLTAACKAHDFATSSPAFQAFNSEADANYILEKLIRQVDDGRYKLLSKPMRIVAAVVGSILGVWENKKTRSVNWPWV